MGNATIMVADCTQQAPSCVCNGSNYNLSIQHEVARPELTSHTKFVLNTCWPGQLLESTKKVDRRQKIICMAYDEQQNYSGNYVYRTFFSSLYWDFNFCVRSRQKTYNFKLYTKVIFRPVANAACSLLGAICNHECCTALEGPPEMCCIRLRYNATV